MHKAIHDKVCARAHRCMHTCVRMHTHTHTHTHTRTHAHTHTHTHTIITQIQMTKSVPIKDLPTHNLTNKN